MRREILYKTLCHFVTIKVCLYISIYIIQLVYLSFTVSELDMQRPHRPDDGHEGLYSITVHDGFVLLIILLSETSFVDNSVKIKKNNKIIINKDNCQKKMFPKQNDYHLQCMNYSNILYHLMNLLKILQKIWCMQPTFKVLHVLLDQKVNQNAK